MRRLDDLDLPPSRTDLEVLPPDSDRVFPADELERILADAVAPFQGHYLTTEDLGEWKGYLPLVWEQEPTVEEIVRVLWRRIEPQVEGLVDVSLVEGTEFDRCRRVTLATV